MFNFQGCRLQTLFFLTAHNRSRCRSWEFFNGGTGFGAFEPNSKVQIPSTVCPRNSPVVAPRIWKQEGRVHLSIKCGILSISASEFGNKHASRVRERDLFRRMEAAGLFAILNMLCLMRYPLSSEERLIHLVSVDNHLTVHGNGKPHFDIGFQLTQFPGKMVMEPKGEMVGALEDVSKNGLCTSAVHERAGS